MKFSDIKISIKLILIVGFTIGFLASCTEDDPAGPTGDEVHASIITEDETWCADKVHYVEGDVVVKNAVLTICEGTTVKFREGSSLIFDDGAALHCGVNKPTALTVFLTGDIETAGSWDRIEFRDNAMKDESYIYYTVIQYGGMRDHTLDIGTDITLGNILLTHSASVGILIGRSARPTLDSVAVTNCLEQPIEAYFDNAHVLNNTVLFQGNLLNFILLNQGTITEDVTWKKLDIPYNINENPNNVENGTWFIDPGVHILMGENARVIVEDGGGLYADGSESTISITGFEKENGYWDTFEFRADANHDACFMKKCTIEFGGRKLQMIYGIGSNLTMEECILRFSATYGMTFDRNSRPTLINNTVTLCQTPIYMLFNNVDGIAGGSYTGNTNNYIEVYEAKLERGVYWDNLDVPYRLVGTINSVVNGTLRFKTGSVIELDDNTRILVEEGGGVDANGVTFTGVQKVKGHWRHFEIRDDADHDNCNFENCTFEYGGSSLAMFNLLGSSPTIKNCTLQYSGACGIYKNQTASPTLEGNTFNDNNGDDICD